MADPIVLPLEEDPTKIEQGIYDYIQSFYPAWNPKEPQLAVLMSEAFANEVSDLRRLATDVGPEILIYTGKLLGIMPIEAAPAIGSINITAINNAGYTIPSGTEMRILISGSEYMGFETTSDAVIAPGQTVVTAVPIRATTNGKEGNGLTGTPDLLDILDYISGLALVGSTSGGIDGELIDDYLSRLRTRLRLLADRPIVPRDFELYAESVVPGVYRALCLDMYNPANGTSNNERMVTMVAVDQGGAAVTSTVKTAMQTALDAARELTFVVNVMDPTYTAITISATVVALPGFDPVTLSQNVRAAVADFVSPANFGKPTIGTGDSRRWILTTKLRYSEIVWVIRSVEGVSYINGPVVINGASNTDLTLTGAAPLPALNPTITITAS